MIKRRLAFGLVLFIALSSFGYGVANALTLEDGRNFRWHLLEIAERQPRYVWGGSESEDKGLDCSGYVYLAAIRAGLPGITRTTARNMAAGLGGWDGYSVSLSGARELDLSFYTWRTSPDRINGHVAVEFRKAGDRWVAHASQTRGRLIVEKPHGRFLTDLSIIRHLTIGE